MSRRGLNLFTVLLFLACVSPASADNDPSSRAVVNASAKELDQIVYKGLVGNLLDGIPMRPSKRVSLQRTNAIVSNTLSGRSLAVLAGLSNPVLLLGGLAWGVWAASNIEPETDGMGAVSDLSLSGAEMTVQRDLVARLDTSTDHQQTLAKRLPGAASATSMFSGTLDEPHRVRPQVVKVWLPQRPPVMAVAQ